MLVKILYYRKEKEVMLVKNNYKRKKAGKEKWKRVKEINQIF